EGKRWFDMLRYNYRHTTGVHYDLILGVQGSYPKNYDGMLKLIARKYTSGGGSGVTSKMPTEPYLYMPIKQDEMDVNALLIQNPVYTNGATIDKNY
ncbi:MAG: RagB/SusD family nutrient uptake outer membrane protein, partial [Bacteroidaceae bacterium]|nr:RagB/SusD family nutrient uptake outer membrane protein [Bacteroidaceae bacterium]